MSITDSLYHPEGHPFETRLVSTETNDDRKPLIEIQPELIDNKKILVLKFIRSKKPIYTFDVLLTQILCYAEQNNYDLVKLEDDALFTSDEDCLFRALIYRAFQNKNSIYVDKGFYPKVQDIELDKLKDIIYNYKIKDAKNLGYFLPEELKLVIENIEASKDDERFGEWLLNEPCIFYRNVINKIEALSKKVKNKEISIDKLNKNTYDFLIAFRTYFIMHQNLIRTPECKKGGTHKKRRFTISQRKNKKIKKFSRRMRKNKTKKTKRTKYY